MFVNKAIIVGNLTRDPEKRALPSGMAVTSFSVATNRVWKDKNGQKQESTDYHNIVVFGRQAETCAQYLRKGQTVFVEGRIQNRSWDAQDGSKKYRTEIVADRVQFGPKSANLGGGSSNGSTNTVTKKDSSAVPVDMPEEISGETIDYPEEEINPEDIPF